MTTDQADSSTPTSIDTDTTDLLIGREKLVDLVADHVQRGMSALVVGAAGMGNSAILQAVARRTLDQVTPRQAIYCSEAAALKRPLHLLAEGKYDRQWRLPTVTTGRQVLSRTQLGRLRIGH